MKANQNISSRRSGILLLVLLIALCVVISGAVLTVYRMPEMAEKQFGPANNALSRAQKIQYSLQLFLNEEDLLSPLKPLARENKFEIQMGEPVYSITNRLQQEGFVPNGEAVRAFLIYSGLDTRIQAGEYQFSESVSVLDLARRLEDPTPGDVVFVVLPGWRLEEIAAAFPTSGLSITGEEFLTKAYNPKPEWLPTGWMEGDSLEGLLAAGEYVFPRETTVDELLETMVNRFSEMVSPEISEGLSSQGLTIKESVILASMVEKEAIVSDEQALIASVFYNRLRVGMKLDSDPTVQYAVGNSRVKDTWWVNPITKEDLSFNSPYNTYVYPGLPPTPICAINVDVLYAVAYPENTPYYYFRANCIGDGRHIFAETYDQHLANACD